MDAGSTLAALEAIAAPALRAGKWAWRKMRHAHFRWKNKKSPLDEIDAIRVARSTLGGSVIAAVPFRNLGSSANYLAVARKSSDEDSDVRIYLLEQVGRAYVSKWASHKLMSYFDRDNLFVTDIDGDGSKEIAFEVESYGSGSGVKSLFVYSPRRSVLAEVSEYYNYSDASAPEIDPIKIDVGDDEQFRQYIVKFAHERGMLQGNEPVDYDLPKFAVIRWHKENGDKRSGRVRMHLYPGEPLCGSSVTAELDTGEIAWTSYFKGPLYGYVKSRDRHFIAYSPKDVYEWVVSLTFDGKLLWFFCHMVHGLFSYDPEANYLRHYSGYAGMLLPDCYELRMYNGQLALMVDEDRGLVIQDTSSLMECNQVCLLNEPHLPKECQPDRYREDLNALLSRLREPPEDR
jgi:hypothetical protein